MNSMPASQWNLFKRLCSKTELGSHIILIILQASGTQDSSVEMRSQNFKQLCKEEEK